MKAIVHRRYGAPEVLTLEDIEKPSAADNEVVVKVRAAGVNPLDWHVMRGTPYLMRFVIGMGRPKSSRFGVDFAGTIETVGKNVKRFKPGDAVFGGGKGAFAESISVREDGALALQPDNLTFEQSASIPVAAVTALQALRDGGRIQTGQRVLINGAAGGVGTFAVQIAKSYGAQVTGVCSTRNVELVQSLGADHVIDYTQADYTRGATRYDLIVDMVGNHSLLDNRRALKPDGRLVLIGGPGGKWLGPLVGPVKAFFLSPFVSQPMGMLLAKLNPRDLDVLRDLVQAGSVMPVIDRTFTLSEVPAAIRYVEAGHARGKVVIALTPDAPA